MIGSGAQLKADKTGVVTDWMWDVRKTVKYDSQSFGLRNGIREVTTYGMERL